MKLFDKRPLALILSITVGGFVIFSFSGEAVRVALLVFSALFGSLSLILFKNKSKRLTATIASVAIIVASLASGLYFDNFFSVKSMPNKDIEIEAVIQDVEYTDYSATLLLESRKIDGRNARRKLVGYIDKSETLNIDVGSVIVFNATPEDFSEKTRSYYYARGFSATVGEIENVTVSSQGEFSIETRLSDFRKMLSRRAIMLSDYEAGTLTAALLLGERSLLSGNVTLDFKDSGISHILALSGMHLTILAAAITFLLTILGVNKKLRALIIIIITVLYMALTGFSTSITRAGIMLIISSILFLLSSTHDALSSLTISVFIIILVSPYAIYDLSLWLSLFATLGIIAFSELKLFKTKPKKRIKRLVRFILTSILASVFAIGATLPFTVVFYDTVSSLSPISTLLFSIPAEIIMYLGSFMLLFGDIIPFGVVLSPIVKGLTYTIHLVAELPGVISSTNFLATAITTAIFAIVFFLFLILNVKYKRAALIVVLILYGSVFTVSHVMTVQAKSTDEIIYLSDQRADAFIVKSDSCVCLIDSSRQTANTSYRCLDSLHERNIVALDKYYVTHYSKKTPTATETVISKIRTNELCLPEPQNETERNILKNLTALADRYKIKITLTNPEYELSVGSFDVRQFYNTPYGEGTSMVGLSIHANGKKHLYISSGMYEGKTKSVTLSEMIDSHTVIFGSHGKKYSDDACFDKRFSKIWTIILSSNGFELTDSAREYYEFSGGEIYTSPTAIDILR